MSTILVTGAEGFLGQGLCAALERRKYEVRRAIRTQASRNDPQTIITGDVARFAEWRELVSGVDAVVHLAARAHDLAKVASTDVAAYRPVNVEAATRLAEAAVAQRVKRFVFVSSIGVNGNETRGVAFTEASSPAPLGAYAISKLEAERALMRLLGGSGTELVIVRPTLIYGPGVKGNLLRLLKLVATGLPIPLGALRAPRNLIGLDNLCDLLLACLEHPNAAGEIFLAAEPERQSTGSVLEAIAARMSFAGRVWRCPLPLVRLAAALTAKQAELTKLACALEVDSSKAMNVLNWHPAVSFEAGMEQTVDWFLRSRGRIRSAP